MKKRAKGFWTQAAAVAVVLIAVVIYLKWAKVAVLLGFAPTDYYPPPSPGKTKQTCLMGSGQGCTFDVEVKNGGCLVKATDIRVNPPLNNSTLTLTLNGLSGAVPTFDATGVDLDPVPNYLNGNNKPFTFASASGATATLSYTSQQAPPSAPWGQVFRLHVHVNSLSCDVDPVIGNN